MLYRGRGGSLARQNTRGTAKLVHTRGRTKLTHGKASSAFGMRLVRRTAKKAWRTDATIPAGTAPHEGLDLSADGVLRKPAARALANEKFEGVDDQQFLQKWLDTVGGKLPETRTVAVRLTPMRENVGSLASYTEEELMKGFVEQDEDVPPFVVRGKLANNGKWAQLNFVSHIAGRNVTTVEVERSMGTKVSNKDVFAALETQVERVLRGENVTLFAFGQVGSGKTYSMSGPEEALVDFTNVKKAAWGIVPLAGQKLITDASRGLREGGPQVSFSVSFVEVCNEQYKDLVSGEKVRCRRTALEMCRQLACSPSTQIMRNVVFLPWLTCSFHWLHRT